MATYTLRMRDECYGENTIQIEADDIDEAVELAEEEAQEWAEGGDWGPHGASVSVWWKLTTEDGGEEEEGSLEVEIEPDHDALVRAAGGNPSCDHEWDATEDIEGGCRENPGVWAGSGTAMIFLSHCTKCGLRRRLRHTGSQRNPGEHDTVEYYMPETEEVE